MSDSSLKYIVDDNGEKISVIMPVKQYLQLLEDIHDLAIVADARVDNREELIRILISKGYIQEKNPTDADLILAAYDCWKESCPEYIIGDFAFAIWDQSFRRLFAARDRKGWRTLHYRFQHSCFQWATEASQILEDPAFPIQINELYSDQLEP